MVRETQASKRLTRSKSPSTRRDARKGFWEASDLDALIKAQGTKPFDARAYPPSFVPDDFDPEAFIALINEAPTEPNGAN